MKKKHKALNQLINMKAGLSRVTYKAYLKMLKNIL